MEIVEFLLGICGQFFVCCHLSDIDAVLCSDTFVADAMRSCSSLNVFIDTEVTKFEPVALKG